MTLERKVSQTEEEFLKEYNPNKYVRPIGLTADIVVFTITSERQKNGIKSLPTRELQLLLIKRKEHPEKGKWALPGGFSNPNETSLETAKRELQEETGVNDIHIEQFGVYDKAGRDKRGWITSIAFFALVNEKYLEKRKASDDAEEVRLFTLEEISQLDLAFDHKEIIHDALLKVQEKMLTTTIAKEFLPSHFTIAELLQVIKVVVPDFSEEKSNFIRKMTATKNREGIISEVRNSKGEKQYSNEYSQRAAQLYEFTNTVPRLSIYS